MTILQAAILGLVQGVTEFLPISSSGHLVFLQELFSIQGDVLTFNILIHVATLMAILVFFGKSLLKVSFKEWILVAIGSVPAVIVGVVFKDQIEAWFREDIFLGFELLLTAFINFYMDRKLSKKSDVSSKGDKEGEAVSPTTQESQVGIGHVGPVKGFLIGIAQAIAIVPGISRSGATVATGIGLGMDREAAFRFSFLLALPALAGAGVLQAFDIVQAGSVNLDLPVLMTGGIVAFVSGLASLKLFQYVIKKAKLEWFGWYCVVLGIAVLIFTFA